MQISFSTLLKWAMEALVVLLAIFSAWPFGSVHAYFQLILYIAVACLLACWAGRTILEGKPIWVPCVISAALAGMCVLAIVQILPMGKDWVQLLSPETARLDEFLMSPEEASSDGKVTLSVAPGNTQRMLLQLIAVVAVFCAVRANLRDPACFRRLAYLSAANGVMLTVIGLGQMVSTPPDTVFWYFPTDGQVFGPFICRNHFAYYVNLCVGLTAGLLMGTRCFLPAGPSSKGEFWRDLLRDPLVPWLGAALGIMVAGLLACLSRGGLIGLMIGGIAGLIILGPKRAARWGVWAVVPVVAGLLVFWMGHDRISHRWERLLDDNTLGDSRAVVWGRTIPLVARFPVLGSGLGSFGLVEPATRVPGDSFNFYAEHAHNDYLELWIEGGTGQIVLAAIVIVMILIKGIRAVRLQPFSPNGRLALGGVIGFISIVVHSFVDFGLHIPAISLFTAVVAAMLVNLGERAEPVAGPGTPLAAWVAWPLALLQAGALMAVAVFLVCRGHAEEQAERFHLASLSPRASESRRLEYLAAALAFAPDRADLQLARAKRADGAMAEEAHYPATDVCG